MLTSKIVDNGTVNEQNSDQFIKDLGIPRLTKEEQFLWRMTCQLKKLRKHSNVFRKTKPPAMMGLLSNFMRCLLMSLGTTWLLDSYNKAFQEDKLSISQRRGIISLIPTCN